MNIEDNNEEEYLVTMTKEEFNLLKELLADYSYLKHTRESERYIERESHILNRRGY